MSPVPANTKLADILRGVVNLQEFGGWQTYARPGAFDPVGIVVHHTGGRNDLNVVINGRSDLPGPLSNLYFDRDHPYRVTLVSGGRCNHAGTGSAVVLEEVRDGRATGPDAAARGLADGPGGNSWFYGFECENIGTGAENWPEAQYDSMVRAAAAICRHHGWTAGHIIGHREWTRRKPDPRGFSMSVFRDNVQKQLSPPPTPSGVPVFTFTPALTLPNPIAASAIDPVAGGLWLLLTDGSIYGLNGARYLGAVNGKTYWGTRTARTLEITPDGKYSIIATTGESYGPGF